MGDEDHGLVGVCREDTAASLAQFGPDAVGCTDCGSCKQVELISMEQLMEMREQGKNT